MKLQPKLDKDGNPIKTNDGYEVLELAVVGNINQLTDKERKVYDALKNIIDDPNNIAKVTLDKSVPMVNTGDYINQIIDLEDVFEYDKNPYGTSGIGAIMHELVEQYEKSKRNILIGFIDKWDKNAGRIENDPNSSFSQDHAIGVRKQNTIDNTDRTQGSIYNRNSGKHFNMLYIDKANDKIIGTIEEQKGNQFTPKETTILPDSNGYYNINATINGQAGKMRFRLKNGQILP